MPSLPLPSASLLVRTDFGDDAAWAALKAAVTQGSLDEGFDGPTVEFVEDPAFDGWTAEALVAARQESDQGSVVLFIADSDAMTGSGFPLLTVDPHPFPGEASQPFRCEAREVCGVEVNLDLANLDWADFAESVDGTGVFRGFDDDEPP